MFGTRSTLTRGVASAFLLAMLGASPAHGQFLPPSDYYASAVGTGETLKDQLHEIIDDHSIRSYGDARSILQVTDRDPQDLASILLAYDRRSLDVSGIGTSIPGWDSGVSWNREHTWPRSLGVGSSGPDNSDLHLLRPSTPSVNSSRGNLSFGGAFGQGFGRVSDGGTRWYPGDEDAGFIARQIFYGAVRYDGSDPGTTNLEIAQSGTTSSLGDLDRLVEWHFQAPPDDFEMRRNQVIFDDYQGNRNPFVDHPEFVWSVFVDQQNDSSLSLPAGVPQADGGFVQALSLGRHYVSEPASATETIRIDKSGNDGTYLRVTGEGFAAASPAVGRYALGTGGPDSIDLEVGQVVDTSSIGVFTGSLTIDNLDVTQGGGAGVGANDSDDVVELRFEVFNHPVASLSENEFVSEISLDLGFLPLSGGLVSPGLSLVNFAGPGAPQMAATLDLDLIQGAGDANELALDLVAFQGLVQGGREDFGVNLDVPAPGTYSSQFELVLSGEDLPGEQVQSLFINLEAEVVSGDLPGDFNSDGSVDAADYTFWRDSLGEPINLVNGVADGVVDERDYEAWLTNFGATSPSFVAVPEPGGVVVCLVALFTAFADRMRDLA